jgi:hypothetical protein
MSGFMSLWLSVFSQYFIDVVTHVLAHGVYEQKATAAS